MKKKMFMMTVLISSCLLFGCSKYQHSNTIEIYDKTNTEELSQEDLIAIKEEEEFAANGRNIEFSSICEAMKKQGFEEELETYIYRYIGKSNYVQIQITSKDGEYCSRIAVNVQPGYFESDDKNKELSDALDIILSNLDKKFETSSLKDIVDTVSNLKPGDEVDYKCTDNITINLSKEIGENTGYSLSVYGN